MDGSVRIGTELDTKSFDKQIDKVQNELNDIKADIDTNDLKQGTRDFVLLEEKAEKLSNTLNKLKKQQLSQSLSQIKNIQFGTSNLGDKNFNIEKSSLGISGNDFKGDFSYIAKNMKDIKIESDNVGKISEKTGEKIKTSFSKGNGSLKRFAFSLVSLGSMYALISKASSSYLSQDTALADKLQSVWVGMGSFLAPVIEYVSDMLLKGLGYLNEFIKALTGVDFIAKANAKALEKEKKATDRLNKSRASFDEMETLSVSTNKNSSSTPMIEIPELDSGIVSKLQDLAYWLKENWSWIEKVGIALGVAFGVAKMGSLVKNIGKLIGAKNLGTGLAGLLPLLTLIAAAWTVYLYIDGYQKIKASLNELNEMLDKNTEGTKGLTEQQKNLSDSFWEVYRTGKATESQKESFINYTNKETDSIINQIAHLESQKNLFGEVTGTNKKLTAQQEELMKQLELVNEDFKELYNQGMLNDNQTKQYKDSLEKQIITMQSLGKDTRNLQQDYKNLTGQNYNVNINANLKDNFSEQLKKIINGGYSVSIGGSFGGGGGGTAFATGGIVTQPTRAIIGEAGYPEAVLPLTSGYLSTLAGQISKYLPSNNSTTIPQTINLTNVTTMNGRTIKKEIKKIDLKNQFATNGR